MGFFTDLYLIYIFKVITRWTKFRGSRSWDTNEATVTATPNKTPATLGYPTLEIPYKYRVNGELYTGLHEEPFLLLDSLNTFAARFTEGDRLVIRIKPDCPGISTVLEADQIASRNELRMAKHALNPPYNQSL